MEVFINHSTCRSFRSAILRWAKLYPGCFSWRRGRTSFFHFLVLEVLLSRTRADSVERMFLDFQLRIRTPRDLALTTEDELAQLMFPLGLYRKRARALKLFGTVLAEEPDYLETKDPERLRELPFIGRYAANAALCFAFNLSVPVVDVNVARVLSRVFGISREKGKLDSNDRLWDLASKLVSVRKPREYNWGLLDIGRMICRPRPICHVCPLEKQCLFAKTKTQNGQ